MSHIVNNPLTHNDEITNDLKIRSNKTFQDSNIFGHKSSNNNTLTVEAKNEITKENVYKPNPTFSSSIFSEKATMEQKNMSSSNFNNPPMIHKYKIQDHCNEDLFGNYKEKKLYDEPIEETEEYVPQYPVKTATNRKNIEIYGHEIEKKPKLGFFYGKEGVGSEENPLGRKIAEQNSNIFNLEVQEKPPTNYNKKLDRPFTSNTLWSDPSTEKMNKNEGIPDDKNYANNRKINEMNSNIFGEKQQIKNENLIPENGFNDNANMDKRKKNNNFSDLFGITNYENQSNIPKSIMASNIGWSQVDSVKQNPFKQESTKQSKENLEKNATCLKHQDMKSTLDTHEYEYQQSKASQNNQKEENIEKKFIVDQNTKAKDLINLQNESRVLPGYTVPSQQERTDQISEVYDFDIKGLDNFFEENKFKRSCMRNGYHLIDFQPKFNNIMNTISSEGRIKIRANDIAAPEEIKQKLKDMGLEVTQHQEKTSKPISSIYGNNVDWKDSNLQIEERRLHSKNYVNAKDSKMKELESNGEMFGSGEGVGKWDEGWKKKKQQPKQKQNGESQEDVMKYGNWNKAMKNLDHKMKKMASSNKNHKDIDSLKVFEPHASRVKKTIK